MARDNFEVKENQIKDGWKLIKRMCLCCLDIWESPAKKEGCLLLNSLI